MVEVVRTALYLSYARSHLDYVCNTLTLDAQRDVKIYQATTATTGTLEVYAGVEYVRGARAITVTDGNVTARRWTESKPRRNLQR